MCRRFCFFAVVLRKKGKRRGTFFLLFLLFLFFDNDLVSRQENAPYGVLFNPMGGYLFGNRIFDPIGDQSGERSGSVTAFFAFTRQKKGYVSGKKDTQSECGETVGKFFQFLLCDGGKRVFVEGVETDDLIQTVDEFRAKVFF